MMTLSDIRGLRDFGWGDEEILRAVEIRGGIAPPCIETSRRDDGAQFVCTLSAGHAGPHEARGSDGRIFLTWDR